jgi:hypothetical protein
MGDSGLRISHEVAIKTLAGGFNLLKACSGPDNSYPGWLISTHSFSSSLGIGRRLQFLAT